jgi:hypothetical protein
MGRRTVWGAARFGACCAVLLVTWLCVDAAVQRLMPRMVVLDADTGRTPIYGKGRRP